MIGSERHVLIHRRGKKRPLIWVQPGPVQTPVLQELDRDLRVHCLYRLRSDTDQPPLTFPQIAAYHIETLRSVCPEGPYSLLGYCVCGTIAHEMAVQLYAQGETVSLIMIDPVDPVVTCASVIQEPAFFRFHYNLTRVWFHLQKIEKHSFKEKIAYIKQSFRAVKRRLTDAKSARQHIDSTLAQSVVDVHSSDMFGFRNSTPQPFAGCVILFRPAIRARNAFKYPNLRWGQLASGGLQIQEVPGDSDSMWQSENAKAMAQIIEGSLAQTANSAPAPKAEFGDVRSAQNA